LLSERYESTLGLDVSEPLVGTALSLRRPGRGLSFAVNQEPDLRGLESASFDLVLCAYVLQHNPPWLSGRYIHEFARILKPGGTLALQMHGATVNPILRLVPPAMIYSPVNLWNRRSASNATHELNRRWDTYWIRPSRIRRLLSGKNMVVQATIRESEPQGRLISYWFRAVKLADRAHPVG
ncbi:MAG: methyltransferase domain-containing protein, partial [Thermoplasmata archaeon]